jgi:Muramidase (phage lambda lysozyme)
MISTAEGTSIIPNSDDGYRVIVGSTPTKPDLMCFYKDHPRKVVTLNKAGLRSTAAGRYQILARFFDAYKKQLDLPDFSPTSQDSIAVQMIKECKAIDDIEAGKLTSAVFKCGSRWASLPGNSYGQRKLTIEELRADYVSNGGKVTV